MVASKNTAIVPLSPISQPPPEWFLENIESVDSEGRRYTRVSIETGGRRNRLSQVAIVHVRPDEEPASVLQKVDRMARAHADKFVRVSLIRSHANQPEDAVLWDLEDDDQGDDPSDDPGTESGMKNATAGLLRQAYQHNEKYLDRMLALQGATLTHVLEENSRLREERADVHQQHTAALEMMRKVEDDAAEVKRKSMREEAIYGTLGTLVQAAAIRLTGTKGGDGPVTAAVRQFVETLSPDQVEKFLGTLSNEQIQLFMSIHGQVVPPANESETKADGEAPAADVVVQQATPATTEASTVEFADAPSE